MKRTHTVRLLTALALATLLVSAGCGKKEAPPKEAEAPAADKAAPAEAAATPEGDEADKAAPAETAEDREPIQPTAAELESYTKEAEKEITAENVKDIAAKLAAEIEGELGAGAKRGDRPAAPKAKGDAPAPEGAPAAGGGGGR